MVCFAADSHRCAREAPGAVVATDTASADADRDNGLEPRAGLPRQRLNGPKYAYFDELAPYLDRAQSVVVYHHFHRGALKSGMSATTRPQT